MRGAAGARVLAAVAALTVLVLLALCAPAPPVHAAANGSWALAPAAGDGPSTRAFFTIEADPGDVVDDAVALSNLEDRARTFRLAAVDARNAVDGAFTLALDAPPEGVGRWIELEVERWTVPARSTVTIPVRMRVPSGAGPGDHAGGIVARPLDAGRSPSGSLGVEVEPAVGVRVYARIGGSVAPALRVERVSSAHGTPLLPFARADARVAYRVTNTGNVRLDAQLTFVADGPFGELRREDAGRLDALLPGSSVVVDHRWSGVPAGGPVEQRLVVDAGSIRAVGSASFFVVPWWLLVVVGVGVALVVVRDRRRIRRLLRVSTATAAVVVVVVGVPTAAVAAPTVDVRTDGDGAASPVRVTGAGWPANSVVVVELCAHDRDTVSTRCTGATSTAVGTSDDGRLSTAVATSNGGPACPCVVRARPLTGDGVAVVVDVATGQVIGAGDAQAVSADVVRTAGDAPAAAARGLGTARVVTIVAIVASVATSVGLLVGRARRDAELAVLARRCDEVWGRLERNGEEVAALTGGRRPVRTPAPW